MFLLHCFIFCSNCSPVTNVVKFLKRKASKVTIIQWFNYFWDVMSTYIANNPVVFENCHVHIDETFIGGKHKYNRGRVPNVHPCWLLGIIDKEQHKVTIQFVQKKDFINIIPIITCHVRPGCTISTDGAKVYKTLSQMNYTHLVCIHKEHFINPANGTHRNWIENFWGNLKIKLKSLHGRKQNRKNQGSIFELLLSDIANYYPI